MKIDLVGPVRRGLAMGLNEFAGYASVGVSALATGWIAQSYSLRPEPFLIGFVIALAGLLLSVFAVRETQGHAMQEALLHGDAGEDQSPSFRTVFARTSWQDKNLFSASQAGLVKMLNDGLAWGLLPIYFAMAGLAVGQIGMLAAVYPMVWGIGQLFTGAASDRLGRKWLIVGGMWVQAASIAGFVLLDGYQSWIVAAGLLGFGTAMVYPTLLAVVADNSQASWRASAVGVYRLWRDSGYAAGALMVGVMADAFSIPWAIWSVVIVTALSGLVVAVVMRERMPDTQRVLAQSGNRTARVTGDD
jgi:MFS family permease